MTSPPPLVFPGDGELAALMRAKDWAATSLGPLETWPADLRATVRMLLTSRFSMWMGWGPDLTFFYNDAYRRDTLGSKHPRALGLPAREVWSEIWDEVGPRIDTVLDTGVATWDEGLLLFLERNGYREETYHTFSYSPLLDDAGGSRGMLCVVTEDTARVIGERRVALLGRLSAEIAGASSTDDVLRGLERSAASDPRDLPFTLTYLFDADGGDGSAARLAASTGFAGDLAPPALLAVDDPRWRLDEILEAGAGAHRALAGAWPAGAWPSGPWPTAPERAYVLPIEAPGRARPAGVFIAGLNPHRVFDGPYREFVRLFEGQLAAGLASARAYEEERRRAESLAALDRAKTAFFSNVSHELRTPLTLVLGPLGDLLADPDLAPPQRAELATMERNGLRLLKLVNTLLEFSRIEAGRAHVQLAPVDLAQLTADVASTFRSVTERAGLALVVDCPPLPAPVQVDRDMWEKIVLNLLSNAFKFTLEGQLTVALRAEGDRAVLEVRDTGVGIPAAHLSRVFERFHRVDGSRGRTQEGTGIGLALVQELVQLHGGAITAQSEVGRGSSFTVSLPFGAARPAEAPAGEPRAAEARGDDRRVRESFAAEAERWLPDAGGAAPAAGAPDRAQVLVADDNADMRAYLVRLLSPRWRVAAVTHGGEALAAAREARPDLVISDVMMPELDGFGLLAALREDSALRELPVILLSARAGEEARAEGLEAGASDYLVKPFSARELLARVEHHLLAAAVRKAEVAQTRWLEEIFRQAPVSFAFLRGPDHVFALANDHYRRLVGGRELVGRRAIDALPEIGSQGFIELLDRVYRTGEPFVGAQIPALIESPDGISREYFFDLVYQPITAPGGEVQGIAAVGHDITALVLAQREAEAASRAKDEFLAMLGHELRNPLAPILTALQLMNQRPGLGAARERAVIERQVGHLRALVDDLLDVARITGGKVELRTADVAVADVTARALEVVSPLLDEHRHAVTVDVPRDLWVHGDPTRLAQVLSNLLANSAKYTPDGGQISVRARREDGVIALAVTDNGIGIDAAMLPHVFELFAQARQSLERARGGLGLGLAIVSNLVALHGGTVHAASEGAGRGSAFTVRLPALEAGRGAPGAEPPSGARAQPPGTARVLVVDDNVDAALMLSDLLEATGYETCTAHDGPSALEAARRFHPQVAVLDLGLPVMDGFELARQMRSEPGTAETSLIAVTGYGQESDMARSAAAGFSAHLVKPVALDQLERAIASLLPQRRGN